MGKETTYIPVNKFGGESDSGIVVIVSSWAINNENLNPEYLRLLEDITPAKPLQLSKEKFGLLSEAVSLCIKFAERENDKLYHAVLKDSCNGLVALVLSQYIERALPAEKLTRVKMVAKVFRETLEQQFVRFKRPAEYAQTLNLSTPYLNECVKNTTGYPVSHHIQQRVILEAKRLLYHSDKSVKEIATALGYDDYPLLLAAIYQSYRNDRPGFPEQKPRLVQ